MDLQHCFIFAVVQVSFVRKRFRLTHRVRIVNLADTHNALLASKSQSEYKVLLRAVVDACRRLGIWPQPQYVSTDFEDAVMRATTDVLEDDVQHVGCFYHMTQSTWRKVETDRSSAQASASTPNLAL